MSKKDDPERCRPGRRAPPIKRDEANSCARLSKQVRRRRDSTAAVGAHLQMAAIVHQHVAAAMTALIPRDAALQISLNLRRRLCLPVPRMSHSTAQASGCSSAATGRAAGLRAPNGGRKKRTRLPIVSSISAVASAISARIRFGPIYINFGCVIVWQPIRCPACAGHDNVWLLPDIAANHEERRAERWRASTSINWPVYGSLGPSS